MPYQIKKVEGGFKVAKKGTKKTYSQNPMTKTKALAQMRAIGISEAKRKKKK